jgi:hypothetical protein
MVAPERSQIYALTQTEIDLLCVLLAQRMVELQTVEKDDPVIARYSAIYKKFRGGK